MDSPIARTPAPRDRDARLDRALMLGALALFLVTRFVGLAEWPVYFFGDEAAQAVRAAELLRNGLRAPDGELLPTFFPNGPYRNLGLSVYAQMLPLLLSGGTFHVLLTRGVVVLAAMAGALAVALILRQAYALRFWWIGALLLGMAPAWFLHSRTAFETVLSAALYAWCLHFYLRYRAGDARSILATLVFAALAFYSYAPAQVVTTATALALLLSDARYHWQVANRNPALALKAAVLAAALALPYLRDHLNHPGDALAHLRMLGSHWTDPALGLAGRLRAFAGEYFGYGLNPAYWYAPENGRDLVRHTMKGYGNLGWPSLPFAALGVAIAIRRWRSPAYRAVIVALLAAPLGAALAQVNVTRALALTVPATLLTALGLVAVLEWIARRIPYRHVAMGAFATLGIATAAMLVDALTHGPLWYRNYGLYGLQYGARQVYARVRGVLAAQPEWRIHISPTWANGADDVRRFFLDGETRVDHRNIEGWKAQRRPLDGNDLLVMTPEEYRVAIADPRFTTPVVAEVIPYPDGSPGFYFVHLAYTGEADAIFAAEDAARRTPASATIEMDGAPATVIHSQLEAGRIVDLFDGNRFTLVRTTVDNPAFVDVTFANPRALSGLALTTGTLDFELVVTLHADGAGAPIVLERTYAGLPPDPTVRLDFAPPLLPLRAIRIAVRDLGAPGDAKIHLREIELVAAGRR